MKNTLKYILILVFFAISFSIFLKNYGLSDHLIKKSWWKVAEPIGLPDVLAFNEVKGNYLKNDTIFIATKARAIILKREFQFFADHKMMVKNIANQQSGTYYKK